MVGSEDALFSVECHREIAGHFQNGELVIIPGAGHIVTLEDPDAVNQGLADWLDRPAR